MFKGTALSYKTESFNPGRKDSKTDAMMISLPILEKSSAVYEASIIDPANVPPLPLPSPALQKEVAESTEVEGSILWMGGDGSIDAVREQRGSASEMPEVPPQGTLLLRPPPVIGTRFKELFHRMSGSGASMIAPSVSDYGETASVIETRYDASTIRPNPAKTVRWI